MSGALPLLLVLVLLLGVAVVLRPVRTVGPVSRSQAFDAAERHARRVTVVAWALLVPVPVLVTKVVTPLLHGTATGAYLGAVPAVAGGTFVLAHLAGELTWPRPDGPVRRAPLVHRSARDVLPRALTVVTATWSLLLGALLVTAALTGGADGRSLTAAHADGTTSTASPFPGWYYGRVIATATAVVLLLCVAVLALVVRRAAVADTDPSDDRALRRTSARRVLAGVQLVVAWTLAGCVFFATITVRNAQPRWTQALGPDASSVLLGVGTIGALTVAVTAVVVAVVGSRATAGSAERRSGPAVAAAARPGVA